MTGGLDYDLNSPGIQKARKLTDGKMETLCVADCIAEDGLLFTPGERWNYSLCHDLLAALVEQVSGMKFRDYVRTRIFEPLEMYDSRYHHTPDTLERAAGQYRFVPFGWETFHEWSDRFIDRINVYRQRSDAADAQQCNNQQQCAQPYQTFSSSSLHNLHSFLLGSGFCRYRTPLTGTKSIVYIMNIIIVSNYCRKANLIYDYPIELCSKN